jgi:capsid protein
MWVDPMKDMNAAKMAVDNHWKTNTDVAADLGNDYGENLEIAKQEQAAAKTLGVTASLPPMPKEPKPETQDDDDEEDDEGQDDE